MTESLSANTQAILLLLGPLIAGGRGEPSTELLTFGEYQRLARSLRQMNRQPSDLLEDTPGASNDELQMLVDRERLKRLLERGFQLSQAVEHWQSRAIWVVSPGDDRYPQVLQTRLKDLAPPVIYGCGDADLLNSGGLAVVGSRHVDAELVAYTEDVGRLAARAKRTVISGGAKGIDQAAMRGALEAGGKSVGVLSDSLERAVMNREHRTHVMEGELTLISPYDPSASFNIGHAMQRNKYIYALADAALIVNSDLEKGGTWAGAVEQLDKLEFVPIYVRSDDDAASGLSALRRKGALPWPNPTTVEEFDELIRRGKESSSLPHNQQLSFLET
jgi:predicted Rossmann fold nucleotide-binding protein DprA/Smf involved in DNA uptake